jgi:YidC/Oxa1 family membrane protein insertase
LELWQGLIDFLTQSLVSLYGIFGSFGIAIIVLTIIVRLIFLPLSIKSTKSMREMQVNQARLKPQLDALKKKYGNDRQKLMEEQGKLYKEMGINPMAGVAGCLPMLIQFPIWIALYSALIHLSGTTEFQAPFLWIPDLSGREQFPYLLAILTGVSTWATQRMAMQPSADAQQKTMNTMMQFMPLMMVFFAFQVPAGLVLYWVASNIFQFFQQLFTTGWGQLWPSRAKPVAAMATASSATVDPNPSSNGHDQDGREERKKDGARKETRTADGGKKVYNSETLMMDGARSVEKNGIRVYTLEPESNSGADYSADEASGDMEESIARAKGQTKLKKKKRRK